MINESNYQEYLDDFMNGKLSEEMELAFVAFLDEHPELLGEVEPEYMEIHLEPTFKHELKKEIPIDEKHLDELALAEFEGNLDAAQLTELEQRFGSHSEFLKSRKLFALTRLTPDLEVVFPHKNRLKKRTVFLSFTRIAMPIAAALISGLLVMRFLLVGPSGSTIIQTVPDGPGVSIHEGTAVEEAGDGLQGQKSDFAGKSNFNPLEGTPVMVDNDGFSEEPSAPMRAIPVAAINSLPVQNLEVAWTALEEPEFLDEQFSAPYAHKPVLQEQTVLQWAYKHVRSSMGAPALIVPEDEMRADATNILMHKVSNVYHSNEGITRIRIGGIVITRSY